MEIKLKIILCYAIAFFFSLAYIIPFLWMLSTAFKPLEEIGRLPITILPTTFTLTNFLETLSNVELLRGFINSLYIAFFTTLVSLIIEAISAYGFSRFNFFGQKFLLFIVLFTNAIPSLLLLIPFYELLTLLNIMNTHVGLFLIYTACSLGFGTWLLIGYFEQVPKELEEAAMVDGCSRLSTIFRIVLPIALPAITVVGIITFVHWWGEFLFALTYLNSNELYTLPVTVYSYRGIEWTHWGRLMAVSTLITIPALFIFIIFQKFIVGGIIAGALKK